MDCKLEPTSRSLVRIECILLQGIVRGTIELAISFLAMPFIPFNYSRRRVKGNGLVKELLKFPLFLCFGVFVALSFPFRGLMRNCKLLWDIAETEWTNRWMASTPKKPNGRPLYIPTAEEDALFEAAIFRSVIRDYGEKGNGKEQRKAITPVN